MKRLVEREAFSRKLIMGLKFILWLRPCSLAIFTAFVLQSAVNYNYFSGYMILSHYETMHVLQKSSC